MVCLLSLWLAMMPAARGLWARDVFVVLSGGGSPFDNNYSQYLQAKALANYFRENYGSNSVWVFFGAGNADGENPLLGDVRRQVKRDGRLLDTWVAGSLPANRPARREAFLRALREEILPVVADGGTLYLLVGDHGSRTHGQDAESIISLWDLKPDDAHEHGWKANDEHLGVAELRKTLVNGIGQGRIVFCMTQCHSGGFHYLGIPHEMTPNPNWFTVIPPWAEPKPQPAFPPAAGYTATDEFSMASGCDPDPDPENWAGYERFLPESLLGMDLLSGRHISMGMHSFGDAHFVATLRDQTIDKPYSTSEQYLERWANLIETRLSKEPNLTGKTKRALANYRRAVNGTEPKLNDPAFRERQSQFRGYVEKLATQNPDPETKKLLLGGSRKQLEKAIGATVAEMAMEDETATPARPRQRANRGRRGSEETRRLWTDTVRPAWRAAVRDGTAKPVTGPALDFEKYLLDREDKGSNYFSGGGLRALQAESYWQSGYSHPQTLDNARAEAVILWGQERRYKILDWAKSAGNPDVRDAAGKLSQGRQGRRPNVAITEPHGLPPLIDEQTAAQRTLFYRRVLAAWEFLLAMDEQPALQKVRELTILERTPLPRPAK